ncbi:hypothetical protein CICLE_v10017569mg, partial [Citrus x clementina]
MRSTPRKCALPRENVKIGLPISTHELPAYSSSICGEDPRADTIHLVQTLGGVRTCMFVPLVDPCIRKGGDPRAKASAEDNKTDKYEFCQPTRCSNKSPRIRYPFRLKAQPTYCGLEGFELSCLSEKTILHLPSSGDYYVHKISYLDSSITITDVNETACPFQSLVSFNLTNSKFFFLHSNESYALYNCTEKVSLGWTSYGLNGPINCLSNENNLVYIIDSEYSMEIMPPSCRKSRTVEIPDGLPPQDIATTARARLVVLGWEALDGCYDCKNSGSYCGFNTISVDARF